METRLRIFWSGIIQWIHWSVVIVGVVSIIAFVRVNWFEADLRLEMPSVPVGISGTPASIKHR